MQEIPSMKDTHMPDSWIKDACMRNPVRLIGDHTFQTGPVRLGYSDLGVPKKFKNKAGVESGEPKYSATILFTPYTDLSLMERSYLQLADKTFPNSVVNGQVYGVEPPFLEQAKHANEPGYTLGLKFFRPKANVGFPPTLYGPPPANEILKDASKFYAGCWVIAGVNLYVSREWKKIVSSLVWVMFFADDQRIGKGAVPPSPAQLQQQISGIQAVAPISVPDFGAGAAQEEAYVW